MPSASRPFVRVYHDDLRRNYPAVYADNAALATWLRLLVIADKMWPADPDIPAAAKGRGLELLVKTGLVEILDHGYRIRGYQAERRTRQDAARNAAALRWHSASNADGNAKGMLVPVPVPSTSTSTKENVFHRGGKPEKVGAILPKVIR